jgi:hypothetical protein
MALLREGRSFAAARGSIDGTGALACAAVAASGLGAIGCALGCTISSLSACTGAIL